MANLFKKGTEDMTELQRAVVFLQEARAKIEEGARFERAGSKREHLLDDLADDIGSILVALEHMGIEL